MPTLDEILGTYLDDMLATSYLGVSIDDERTDKDRELEAVDATNKAKGAIKDWAIENKNELL